MPQEHYAAVSDWVDSRRLTSRRTYGREVGVRLVYERVPEKHVPLQRPHGGVREVYRHVRTPLRQAYSSPTPRKARKTNISTTVVEP